VFFVSCRKDPALEPLPPEEEPVDTTEEMILPVLPDVPYDYESVLYPDHIMNDPNLAHLVEKLNKNAITNEGATLGRVLFYDKNLSANNTISCASCHQQDKAFTDGLSFSPGYDGGMTARNSMAIINSDLMNFLFWDHRAVNTEMQVMMPIQDPVEMGMTLEALEDKLQKIDYYKPLFEAAFGDTVITSINISLALGQFVKSIRSYRSKYDEGVPQNFANFTAEEEMGRQLFFTPSSTCFQCHFGENFGGLTSENIGLDAISTDPGIYGITGDLEDLGKFNSVSLRNIELTSPYMHDGRFQTLEEVVEFYMEGKEQHANLDFRLTEEHQTGATPLQIEFTDSEKDALIAFLKTLTDWELVSDPKYSDPFPE
jgi:cytochrome c peroxidase